MPKISFKPTGPDYKNENVTRKDWDILVDGQVRGAINSDIRDLWMDLTNPGYSVTVTAQLPGVEPGFRRYSAAFSNRSAKEARENRSRYVAEAKEWARKKGQ
jgi:hypothetical protein